MMSSSCEGFNVGCQYEDVPLGIEEQLLLKRILKRSLKGS